MAQRYDRWRDFGSSVLHPARSHELQQVRYQTERADRIRNAARNAPDVGDLVAVTHEILIDAAREWTAAVVAGARMFERPRLEGDPVQQLHTLMGAPGITRPTARPASLDSTEQQTIEAMRRVGRRVAHLQQVPHHKPLVRGPRWLVLAFGGVATRVKSVDDKLHMPINYVPLVEEAIGRVAFTRTELGVSKSSKAALPFDPPAGSSPGAELRWSQAVASLRMLEHLWDDYRAIVQPGAFGPPDLMVGHHLGA